ncbi:MAG: hypothetical protein AAF703_10850 [Cyanobacteria bacterium P01_D01_bin.105]
MLNHKQPASSQLVSRQSALKASALSKASSAAASLSTPAAITNNKLLLHVLDLDELPYEMVTKPKRAAFRGQKDVYISRAELELKKAMQTMSFSSRMSVSDLPTLTALSLPSSATAITWTVYALLQEKFQKENDPSRIHHRNHDAKLLYRELAQMNLMPWATQLVDQVHASELGPGTYMPPGHPVPGYTYRRHPFRHRQNYYYPVDRYFSMLYEEREQAMIALLSELGATKITISAPIKANACEGVADTNLHQRVFEYPQSNAALPKTIDINRHPWLTCESSWQGVVRERLNRGILATQFEIDLDVVNMLRSQIKSITRLVSQLDSMVLCDTCEEKLMLEMLQPRQVKVEFSPADNV